MKNRNVVVGIVVLFALMAVVMAVVSVKLSPLDKSRAAFVVEDAYLRSTMPSATTAAAFLVLRNQTGRDDVLLGVRSDLAGQVALHRHSESADGVMRMGEISGGVPLPDGAEHVFGRAGDHLMFTGLTAPLEQGQIVPATLSFETAGDVTIQIPVDLER